ncbi:uncharacterized protein LOC133190732 [Saccostrea echinata]|uniref:uncharacterized protein LOC133190732 n=1 Tax=Saccostrea echinata TaxID=191078 RepID=UPI002A841973|nr:uncharacterized protein LOC133190732 [Saccostrea echinata]
MKLEDFFWSVLFLCILTLVFGKEQCSLNFTADPLYIFFGEKINLSCTLLSSRAHLNSSENIISIKRHNLNISSNIHNNDPLTARGHDVVSVNMIPEQAGYLAYVCTSPICEGKKGKQFLTIEHRPQKVVNGSCLVFNWQNMTCVWDLGVVYRHSDNSDMSITAQYNTTVEDFTHLDYDVSLHWSVYTHLSPCKNVKIEGKCLSCTIMENDGRDSYKRGAYVFVVNITNNRRPETSVSSHFYFNTDELVQPAKVENIRTEVNKTGMMISWSHSKPYMSLRFKIEYRSEWESAWKEEIYTREIDDFTDLTEISRRMSTNLVNLIPYTTYKIRISCIPIVQGEVKGFWSEVTTIKAKTLEDVPSAVPRVQPSFFSCLNVTCDKVEIYWKPIEQKDIRCAVMQYKIESMSPKSPHHKPVYANQNSVSAKMPISTNVTNNISIIPFNGKTNQFPDLEPSVLVIPPKSQWPKSPVHTEALSNSITSRHVTLSWSFPAHFKNIPFNGDFTVVWCKKSNEGKCQGELNWLTTVSNTSHHLEVSEGTTVDDYMYGIAANGYFGGLRSSSGIAWVECVHFTNKTLSEKLNVKFVLDDIDQNAMKIVWYRYNCKQFRGHVTQYRIKYCEFRSCEETSTFANVSRYVSNYTLRGLSPTKYSVWVSAVSDAGPGPSSEVEFLVFGEQTYSNHNERVNIAKMIIIMCGVLGGVTLLVLLSYCSWRHCRNLEETEIILPDIKKNEEYDKTKSSASTSGRGSSTESSLPAMRMNSVSSGGTYDSGCGQVGNFDDEKTYKTDYIPLQIQSSCIHDSVRDKYYDPVEFQNGGNTLYPSQAIRSFSERSRLLGQKEGPISEESAYISDMSSKNKSSQPSVSSEELRPLVTQADDNAHESDESSGDRLQYSTEDISCVLDNCESENENPLETGTSSYSGSLPEYLPPHSNTNINPNRKSPSPITSSTICEIEGYVLHESVSAK